MSEIRRRLEELLERLSPRERVLVGVAGATTVLIVVWLWVSAAAEHRAMLRTQIAAHERELASMTTLRDHLLALQADTVAVHRRLAASSADLSLFSHLEGISRTIMSREQIASMNPSSRTLNDDLRREDVAMRLAGVTLRDIVALLRRIEKGALPLLVGRLRIKKRYDESRLLDATLVVSRLIPVTAADAP